MSTKSIRTGKPYQFYLPTQLWNRAMKKAKKSHLSLAAWIRLTIEKALSE